MLIVGAGPAGLAAARVAAKSGAQVMLVDEQSEIGGSLLSETDIRIDSTPAWDWLAAARAALEGSENVTVLPRTTATGYYHQNFLGLAQRLTDHLPGPITASRAGAPRERLWRVRAKQVVLAQGAIERPLLFDGNDRPGVMLAGAARTFLNRYGVLVGRNPVLVTSDDSAYRTAFDLAAAGAHIGAIVDIRRDVPARLQRQAEALGIPLLKGWNVTGTSGRKRIKSVRVDQVDRTGGTRTLSCDALLMCGGWTPSVHLFSHAKGRLEWSEERDCFVPGRPIENARCAGAGNGTFGLSEALAEGMAAGAQAARDAGFAAAPWEIAAEGEMTFATGRTGPLPAARMSGHGRAFVDFQNDVTANDIRLAVREGFHSIEHIKRYTTTGMATDQGKTSNINGLSVAAEAVGKKLPLIGLTSFRPPFTPTTFGTVAGHNRGPLFEVTRKTPIDGWAVAHGAIFEPVSLWRRAHYFAKPNEGMAEAVRRECRATRQSLGIFDASTLGKIEIVGPDAAEFLDRIYTNPCADLAPGRCRYALFLGEDGFIRDDGVIGRLTADRFHVTTTTGGAGPTLATMEDYLQTEWPHLKVWLTSTTEQWAVIALSGPNTRRLLAPLVEDIDLSSAAFPHMSLREGKICDVPTRLFRVSFTGELGYEVNVPAQYGLAVWRTLIEAGRRYDITPYGTEAMHVLRAEKGYIIVGQDTDGTVTPQDAGLNWAIGKEKTDFVGQRSLSRPDMLVPSRRQLVGLLTDDPALVLEVGAQIVADPDQPIPMKSIGHVTSAYWSDALGRSIALALVEGGRQRIGERAFVPMPGRNHAVAVAKKMFVDPAGGRLNE